MVVIDTNVVSELMRLTPDPAVVAWFSVQDSAELYLTAVTEAELRAGAAILPPSQRRDRLAGEVDAVVRGGIRRAGAALRRRLGQGLRGNRPCHRRGRCHSQLPRACVAVRRLLYLCITTIATSASMHTTNLRRVGGSIMLAVPPALLDLLRLRVGAKVDIAVENGRLIVEPRKRPIYSLDELLAQCDATDTPSTEDRAWIEAGPVGNELL